MHLSLLLGFHREPNTSIDWRVLNREEDPIAVAICVVPKTRCMLDKDNGNTIVYFGM